MSRKGFAARLLGVTAAAATLLSPLPSHANSACTGFNNGSYVGITVQNISACTVVMSGYLCQGAGLSTFQTIGYFTRRSPECAAG